MGFFKWSSLIGALVASMAFSGCTEPNTSAASSSSGSLALSTDDQYLYAADTDNGVVSVMDVKTEQKVADIKVGKSPARVVVGLDDTIYVSNRGDRSVSVIRKGDWQVAARIPTGVDPNGMAVSADGRTLYVVSTTSLDDPSVGTLTAVDTATLQPKWETRVGNEPRAVAIVAGNKALVTRYREGDLVQVDLGTGAVTNEGKTSLYAQANKTKIEGPSTGAFGAGSPLPPSGYSSFQPRALNDVVASPDGKRAYVPTVWAREDAIGQKPNSSGGYYAAGGPCNLGSVATAGIVTLDTSNTSATSPDPRVDDLTDCASRGTNTSTAGTDFPPSTLSAGSPTVDANGNTVTPAQIQGPTVAAVDSSGSWLYVVNRETSNVAVMPTSRRDAQNGETIDFQTTGSSLRSVAAVNEGATRVGGLDGIALTRDGLKAFTYSQFEHRVYRLGSVDANGQPARGPAANIATTASIDLGLTDLPSLTADQRQGRIEFFDAADVRISSVKTTVSCNTCHLEGRDDAHVWSFPDGKRQTPSLIGRGMEQTKPFHWSGEFPDTNKFMQHTMVQRMGGSGANSDVIGGQLMAWLSSLPLPENALQTDTLSERQSHGAQLFQKAQCGSCHSGEFMTNNGFENVGTRAAGDVLPMGNFNVPSLRGLGRSAPYLHDGSAKTLADRVNDNPNDLHGVTSNLSTEEKTDLVEYLKTL